MAKITLRAWTAIYIERCCTMCPWNARSALIYSNKINYVLDVSGVQLERCNSVQRTIASSVAPIAINVPHFKC